MESLPKVTFGFVNCNRLHYLKSCIESLIVSTDDYENREFIVVDNASVEEGTEGYLNELEERGFTVLRQQERDPANEYAKACNFIVREATGDFISLVTGDIQFILKGGWLKEYVDFYSEHKDMIGCIAFDAQRRSRIRSSNFSPAFGSGNLKFVFDTSRFPISGAGNVLYSREIIEMMYPWDEDNASHEGGPDSESKMLHKIVAFLKENELRVYQALPLYPNSVSINTDARGTNARVRGNKRYGDYWAPKQDFRYYELNEFNKAIKKIEGKNKPLGIEEVVTAVGWDLPLDEYGDWKKNPIRPETASEGDYGVLYPE